jgi:hypothetical protein
MSNKQHHNNDTSKKTATFNVNELNEAVNELNEGVNEVKRRVLTNPCMGFKHCERSFKITTKQLQDYKIRTVKVLGERLR